MPVYGYTCLGGAEGCGKTFEIKQSMADPPLQRCPTCGYEVRRIIFPPAVMFRGSGFYVNDSRPAPPEE